MCDFSVGPNTGVRNKSQEFGILPAHHYNHGHIRLNDIFEIDIAIATYAPRSAFLLKANGAFLERKKQTPYIRM